MTTPKFNMLFLSCAAALSLPVTADELKHFQSFAGYTGLINTPNAEVMGAGTVDVGYNNQLDFKGQLYMDGHNFIFSTGLFQGLEVSGQIASNSMHDNMFSSEGKGQTRDLSFNAKYQTPFLPKNWFSLAVGMKDIGGAGNNYKTTYIVASKDFWGFRFSAGVSDSNSQIGDMDGAFAGIEWQPLEWFSLLTEYDAEAVNAAARITVPKEWLFDVGELTLTSRFYSSTEFSEEQDTYWGVNFSLPLSGEAKDSYVAVKPAPEVPVKNVGQTNLTNVRPTSLAPTDTNSDPEKQASNAAWGDYVTLVAPKNNRVIKQPTTNNSTVQSGEITQASHALKNTLINDGVENVKVGYSKDTVFVNFENAVFNRNNIDAIGLVLGRVTEHFADTDYNFAVQLAKSDLALITVEGSVKNYQAFIAQNISPDLTIQQGKLAIPGGVVWSAPSEQNSPYFKPRLTLAPALSSTYATEFGVLDYSLGLRATLDLPLWQGGGVNVAAQTIVAESDDFEDRKVFDSYSLDEGIVNASLYQTFALPFGFYNQTQLGFYKDYFDYKFISNETAWLSPEGRHKVSAKFAYFDYADYRASREYQTFAYQYNWVEQDITLHATAGNYFYEDSGYKFESRFWFGDSYVAVSYQDMEAQKVGIAINIPLTPRKDMNVTTFGQLKGQAAWRTSVSTRVGNDANTLIFNEGHAPSTAITLDNMLFNKGRLTPSYLRSNLARMKEAYESYK